LVWCKEWSCYLSKPFLDCS